MKQAISYTLIALVISFSGFFFVVGFPTNIDGIFNDHPFSSLSVKTTDGRGNLLALTFLGGFLGGAFIGGIFHAAYYGGGAQGQRIKPTEFWVCIGVFTLGCTTVLLEVNWISLTLLVVGIILFLRVRYYNSISCLGAV